MEHDAARARRAQRELRSLLNKWDPIGVFDPESDGDDAGPVDEYDCIRDPLIAHLLRGDSRYEIAGFLRDELTGHFGLEPWLVTTNVIDRIFDWWESAKWQHHIAPDEVDRPGSHPGVPSPYRPFDIALKSTGTAATQTVPHVHFHIVPRWNSDDMKLEWPDDRLRATPPKLRLSESFARSCQPLSKTSRPRIDVSTCPSYRPS